MDGLERKTGMNHVLECHGTMAYFHCTGPKCKKKRSLKEIEEDLKRGEVVYCESCDNVMKPGVTFFGETIPKAFDRCLAKDVPKVDLVVVIGTSLKVGGSVYELIRQIPDRVPQNKASAVVSQDVRFGVAWQAFRRNLLRPDSCRPFDDPQKIDGSETVA